MFRIPLNAACSCWVPSTSPTARLASTGFWGFGKCSTRYLARPIFSLNRRGSLPLLLGPRRQGQRSRMEITELPRNKLVSLSAYFITVCSVALCGMRKPRFESPRTAPGEQAESQPASILSFRSVIGSRVCYGTAPKRPSTTTTSGGCIT